MMKHIIYLTIRVEVEADRRCFYARPDRPGCAATCPDMLERQSVDDIETQIKDIISANADYSVSYDGNGCKIVDTEIIHVSDEPGG